MNLISIEKIILRKNQKELRKKKKMNNIPALNKEQEELKETYIKYAEQFIGDMNNAKPEDKFGIVLRFKIDINKISREYERERKNEK